MKKIIYSLAIFGALFTSCDPIEEINEEIDIQDTTVVGDLVYELTDEDYETLDKGYGNFDSEDEAKLLIPDLLTEIKPVWGEGSTALVTFKVYNPVDTYAADIYELEYEEYEPITGDSYGNFSSSSHVYSYLEANYPDAEDGDFVSLRYDYYSGVVSTLTDGFAYEDGSWTKFTGFTEDQYLEMGESYPNFSSSDEADQKIPIALLDIYKYETLTAGQIVLSMYELYSSGTTTSYTAAYIYNGSTFEAYGNEMDVEIQFGHDGTTWVPDNTIKYTISSDDIAYISSALISTYPGPADNVGYFGSFDRRSSSSNYWTDQMLLEAFNLLLDNIDPSAEEGQKYVLTYVIYNGSTTNETMYVIKEGGVWIYQ